LSSAWCFSQTSSTALSGTVYDPSGGVIGSASVTVANDARNVSFKQITNESGLYSFPSIAVGTYTVTVDIGRFKTKRLTGITLNVATPGMQNIMLESVFTGPGYWDWRNLEAVPDQGTYQRYVPAGGV
jgi:hypothetical protein